MNDSDIGFLLVAVLAAVLAVRLVYNLMFWRTYNETWAWMHQRHILTGDERHIQKVRGVPMVPPPRPDNAPPPPRKG